MTSRWIKHLPLTLLLIAGGCSEEPAREPVPSASTGQPAVFATYAGGEVNAVDLDDAIGRLPGPMRTPQAGGEIEWVRALTKRIVVDRILLEEAS